MVQVLLNDDAMRRRLCELLRPDYVCFAYPIEPCFAGDALSSCGAAGEIWTLSGCSPVVDPTNSAHSRKVYAAAAERASIKENVHFLDLHASFSKRDTAELPSLLIDGLHLSPSGNAVVTDEFKRSLASILK